MATINQLTKDLERKKADINKIIIESTTTAMGDAVAVIRRRVQETGVDANNKKFKPYTESYLRFKRGGVYITRTTPPKKKKRPNRAGNNLVNLTYTGEMWRSIGVISTKKDNNMFTIVAGGRDQETKDKMKWNSVKRPFFFLSDEETKAIVNDWRNRIVKFKTLLFK